MKNYLIEIGTEELPADYIDFAITDFSNKVKNMLEEHGLSYDVIENFSTPRRLTLLIKNLKEYQEEREFIQRGPSVEIGYNNGEPTPALLGFSKSQGVDINEIEEHDGYLFAKKTIPPVHVSSIIIEEIPQIIKSIYFPKRMTWDNSKLQFARPIRWIVSILDDEVIEFGLGNIKASNCTKGHRVLGQKSIKINKPTEYEQLLEENYVIADAKKRKNIILSELERNSSLKGGKLNISNELLNELKNIVEFPTAIVGNIKEDYLNLPSVVITTAIEEHLRFVPIYKDDENLLPYFISIVNGDAKHQDVIITGNEKVLGARLQDAKFFFEDDLNTSLDEFSNKLDGIVYQEKLGTIKDRVDRLVNLNEKIADQLSIADHAKEDLLRAAEISKSDLLTGMVNEFPELQGIMGEIYAENQGESNLVSTAIREQYLPRFSEDDLPETTVGSILSISDKLDAICGMFAVDIIPTGSQDPFGLRRAAIGIINIIINNKWNIDLKESIKNSLYSYVEENSLVFDYDEVMEKIYSFFMSRIKVALESKSLRYDIIDGLLSTDESDIYNIFKKAEVLDAWFKKDRTEILDAIKRIHNITSKHSSNCEFDEGLFNEYETGFYDSFKSITNHIEEIGVNKEFEEALNTIENLAEPINTYFDNVLVFEEDDRIKDNRLGFLKHVEKFISSIFDFSKIVD